MKVILIQNDDGGIIGIVTEPKYIIDCLIDYDWLSGASTIYNEDGIEETVLGTFGRFWEGYLKACSLKELQYIFGEVYVFTEYEIYA